MLYLRHMSPAGWYVSKTLPDSCKNPKKSLGTQANLPKLRTPTKVAAVLRSVLNLDVSDVLGYFLTVLDVSVDFSLTAVSAVGF